MKTTNTSEYAIDCWNSKLGVTIVKEIVSKDWSAPYEMDAAHVFRLSNDEYAVVIERGCSCYSYDDAEIEVVKSKDEALKLFTAATSGAK